MQRLSPSATVTGVQLALLVGALTRSRSGASPRGCCFCLGRLRAPTCGKLVGLEQRQRKTGRERLDGNSDPATKTHFPRDRRKPASLIQLSPTRRAESRGTGITRTLGLLDTTHARTLSKGDGTLAVFAATSDPCVLARQAQQYHASSLLSSGSTGGSLVS